MKSTGRYCSFRQRTAKKNSTWSVLTNTIFVLSALLLSAHPTHAKTIATPKNNNDKDDGEEESFVRPSRPRRRHASFPRKKRNPTSVSAIELWEQESDPTASYDDLAQQSANSTAILPGVGDSRKQVFYGILLTILALGSTNTVVVAKEFQAAVTSITSTLAIAWLPTIVWRGNWIEWLSLSSLFLQHSSRRYILQEFFPKMQANLKKLLLAELWRHIWSLLGLPRPTLLSPPPLLTLSTADLASASGVTTTTISYVRLLVFWVQKGWHRLHEIVENSVHNLMKQHIKQSVMGTFGSFYDSFIGDSLSDGEDTDEEADAFPQFLIGVEEVEAPELLNVDDLDSISSLDDHDSDGSDSSDEEDSDSSYDNDDEE